MRRVEFFLYPDALGLDIVGPLEVFSTANELLSRNGSNKSEYKVIFSAEKPGLVPLNSGLQLKADIAIGKGRPADIFLVPGGVGVERVTQDSDLLHRIYSQATQAKRIVSVCGGAFILAACGLLKGIAATTHWESADSLARLYPDVQVESDAIFVREGKISTSAGVTAGIDLALALVEEDLGSAMAMKIARMLVVYLRRTGGQSQFSAPLRLHAKVKEPFDELYSWLRASFRCPVSVEAMATRVAMSPRNFSRKFKRETGVTPGKFLEQMRIDCAKELLETSGVSIETVAEESGFEREERLRRVFVRQLGITPSQYRAHFKLSQ